jgi:hypothetical protein
MFRVYHEEGERFLQNFGTYLSNYAASYPRRFKSKKIND